MKFYSYTRGNSRYLWVITADDDCCIYADGEIVDCYRGLREDAAAWDLPELTIEQALQWLRGNEIPWLNKQ